ncbi:MAG: hypothetical protein F4123_01380 [Gemmatimonadetes bacterium]|nr:hypothetical protein [Gemmatimonadota bacterium]MYB97048.1 hypothetical protein [Gemmatimonadota bacterium]MYI45040.1 hypothetical protein [Gemmatimonadota bacterium]
MSISREAADALASILSESKLEAEVAVNETAEEAHAVRYGAWVAAHFSYFAALKLLDRADRETLMQRIDDMREGLEGLKPARFVGYSGDAHAAAIGEFRSAAEQALG